MFDRMKVTALIPDEIVRSVQKQTGSKTITEGLVIALRQWLETQQLRSLNRELKKKPLKFRAGFRPEQARELNRRK